MMRFLSMLGAVVVCASLGALALSADGSAMLGQVQVTLTATGPSPSAVEMPAGSVVLFFVNDDSVSHSVAFGNGQCSLDIAPGDNGGRIQTGVNACFPSVGSHLYKEDGTFPGTVNVVAMDRRVTLGASTHTVRRGSRLRLEGVVAFAPTSGESVCEPPFPVVVLARANRQHPFHRVGKVAVTCRDGVPEWRLAVRPGRKTTYVAELNGDSEIWRRARSAAFTVRVRP